MCLNIISSLLSVRLIALFLSCLYVGVCVREQIYGVLSEYACIIIRLIQCETSSLSLSFTCSVFQHGILRETKGEKTSKSSCNQLVIIVVFEVKFVDVLRSEHSLFGSDCVFMNVLCTLIQLMWCFNSILISFFFRKWDAFGCHTDTTHVLF